MARDVNLNQAVLEDLQALSADAQRAWFVLRLDPRIGLTDMGRIALPSVAKALDLSIEKARKVLGELCQAEGGTGCEYDERAGLLWFRGAFAREPKSPTVLRAVLTELQRLPSSEVVGRWLARYGQAYESIEPTTAKLREMVEAASALRSRYGIDTVSIPYRDRIDTVPRAGVPLPVPVPDPERQGEAPEVEAAPADAGDHPPPPAAPGSLEWGMQVWASECRELPTQPSRVTPKRRKLWGARARESGFVDAWPEICRRVAASPLCRGEVPGKDGAPPWHASMDWLLQRADAWVCVMEGRYDARCAPRAADPGKPGAHAAAAGQHGLSAEECESAARDAEGMAARCEAQGRASDAEGYWRNAEEWRDLARRDAREAAVT